MKLTARCIKVPDKSFKSWFPIFHYDHLEIFRKYILLSFNSSYKGQSFHIYSEFPHGYVGAIERKDIDKFFIFKEVIEDDS